MGTSDCLLTVSRNNFVKLSRKFIEFPIYSSQRPLIRKANLQLLITRRLAELGYIDQVTYQSSQFIVA